MQKSFQTLTEFTFEIGSDAAAVGRNSAEKNKSQTAVTRHANVSKRTSYLAGRTMAPMAVKRSISPLANFSSSNFEAELIKAELNDK